MSENKIPPKPGKDTIYVDVDDEITSIIDKVEGAKEKVVALVLPKRSTALQSIVNMRLLKRHADGSTKNVVLITSEPALLPLAGVAGLHVASSLTSKPQIPAAPNGAATPKTPQTSQDGTGPVNLKDEESEEDLPEKIDYDKSVGDLAAEHEYEIPDTIEIGEDEEAAAVSAEVADKKPKLPKDKALKVPNFNRFRLMVGLGVVGLIGLIVFLYLAVAVLPKATIAIQTTSTPVSATINLQTTGTASKVNNVGGTILGYAKTSDQTATQNVSATGQLNNGDKATGTVYMKTSDCSSKLPASITAGTGVSSAGLTFISQQTATFTPTTDGNGNCYYKSGNVNVIAQQGGKKYNMAAGTNFSVAGYASITATNTSDFAGGTDNITTVVSQSDVDNASQKLVSASTSGTFAKTFEDQLATQGYYVFTSTLKTGDPQTTATPAVGQAATTTAVTIKITYSVLAVQKSDLKLAISSGLASQIDKNKQKVDDTSVLADSDISVTNQTSPTEATLNAAVNTSAIPIIDPATVKKQVAGKKSGDITSSINNITGVKNVTVHFSPFWVSSAPSKTSKITVTIQHVNGS